MLLHVKFNSGYNIISFCGQLFLFITNTCINFVCIDFALCDIVHAGVNNYHHLRHLNFNDELL